MKKPIPPCRECEDRAENCKANCELWKAHDKAWKAYKEIVNSAKANDKAIRLPRGKKQKEVLH